MVTIKLRSGGSIILEIVIDTQTLSREDLEYVRGLHEMVQHYIANSDGYEASTNHIQAFIHKQDAIRAQPQDNEAKL